MDSKKSFGEHFKAWRQARGVSAYRMAKLTGVHPSFISNIESNRRAMSESYMQKLAAVPEFQLSYETLRAWKLQTEYAPQELQAALGLPETDPMKDPLNVSALEGLYRIPLKMTVAAGGLSPKDAFEEPVYIDWYGIQTLSTDLFCIQVKGDSMWPPVPDGAMLLVREVHHLKSGEKYVVETADAQMTFKLIQFDQNGARLLPLNPEHPPIPLETARLKRLYQVLSYKVDWT